MLSSAEQNELASITARYGGGSPLDATPDTTQATAAASSGGIMNRIGKTIVNLPSTTAESMANFGLGLLQSGVSGDAVVDAQVPKPFDLAPPQGLAEHAVDALGGIVSSLPQYLGSEFGIGKVAESLGAAGPLLSFIKAAGAGVLNGAVQGGPVDAATQGGLLGAQSLLSGLPRIQRILPNLALAAAAGGATYAQTKDTDASAINAGIVGALGMLPGGPKSVVAEANRPLLLGDKVIDSRRVGPNYGGQLPPAEAPNSLYLNAPQQAVPMDFRLPDRPDPTRFETGNVTSQFDGKTNLFRMGADTTVMPNEGLTAPESPFQLMGRDEPLPTEMKSITPVMSPLGPEQHTLQLPPSRSQIISTAFTHPTDGTIHTGSKWDQPHEGIGMEHDVDEVPQANRGFLVHKSDGTQVFMNREDAHAIALESGQHRDPTLNQPLNSTDLRNASVVPEKGAQGVAAPVLQPPQNVTSQSKPFEVLKGDAVGTAVELGHTRSLYRAQDAIEGNTSYDRGQFYAQSPAGAAPFARGDRQIVTHFLPDDSRGYSTPKNKHALANDLGVFTHEQGKDLQAQGVIGEDYHAVVDKKLADYFRANDFDYYSLRKGAETIVVRDPAAPKNVTSQLADPVPAAPAPANPLLTTPAPVENVTSHSIIPQAAAPDYTLTSGNTKTQEGLNKLMGNAVQRIADTGRGEATLAQMEETSTSAADVVKTFWQSTYNKLSEATQAKFHKYIASVSGFSAEDPVDVYGQPTKSWADTYPASLQSSDPSSHGLEGTERGLIVLMHQANEGLGNVKEASGSDVTARPTPLLEAGSPKAEAASGGDSNPELDHLLNSPTSHLSAPDAEDVEYYREKYKEASAPDAIENGYTPQAAEEYLTQLRTAIGRGQEPVLPAEDSPKNVTSHFAVRSEASNSLFDISPPTPSFSEAPTAHDAYSLESILSQANEHYGHLTEEAPPEGLDVTEAAKALDEHYGKDIASEEVEAAADDAANSPKPAEESLAMLLKVLTSEKRMDIDKVLGLVTSEEKKATKAKLKRATKTKIKSRAEQGAVDVDMLAYIARYGVAPLVGGTIGAQVDKENRLEGFLYGAMLGGLTGKFGPGMIRMLMKDLPNAINKEVVRAKDLLHEPGSQVEDLFHLIAAQDLGATGDGFASWMRRAFKGFSLSEIARDIQSRSNLSGMLAAHNDVVPQLRSYYEKMSAAEKDIYARYSTEPAYIKSRSGAMVRNTAIETKFALDMMAHPEFVALAGTVRRLRIEAQELVANSLPNDGLRKQILNSLGTYMTDAFRIFNESTWRPSQAMIDSAIKEIKANKLFPDYNETMIGKVVTSYLDNIYRNRQMYEGGQGQAKSLDQILKGKARLPEALEKKLLAAVPSAKSVDEIVTSHSYLPPTLRSALAKAIRDGEYLTPAFRNMLGYYTDPIEKEAATMLKLMPAARVAKHFELISRGVDKLGLKLAYGAGEAVDLMNKYEKLILTAPTAEIKLDLQRKLLNLRNRTLLPLSDSLGILSGKYVPADLADTLPDMSGSVYGKAEGPVMNAVSEFHRFIKVGATALNPVSHVRQIVSTPILGALAGTNPMQIWKGFQIARGATAATRAVMDRMRSLGIADVNEIQTHFNQHARQALTGYLDRNLMDRFLATPVVSHIVDAYHYPDTALRIGTFLAHEQRVLKRLAGDVSSGRVTSQMAAKMAESEALTYTNRYTMNYANIPGGLRELRKMPFVSLYLSYQAEIARITKNITMDAIGRDSTPTQRALAMTKLAGLAVVPAALQAMSTSNLTPEEKKEWEASRRMDQPYAQQRFRYVLGKRADGSFKFLDFSPLIPTDEFNRFFAALSTGNAKQVLANNPLFGLDNTPALNVASELITGQNSRTGRPINTIGRAVDAARTEVAPSLFGGYEFDNLMRALQPNADGGIGVQRLGSGKGYSIQDLLVTYVSGLRPTSVNVDWQRHTTVQQATNAISVEKQYMMDTVRSNMAPEAKQAAVERYSKAVKLIVEHLQDQLGQ